MSISGGGAPELGPELGPDLPGLRCLGLLGSGGFADVYLYERDHPRVKVAVKLVKATALDDGQRRQFIAEADAMAELSEHPHIVPVQGAGTAPDGRPYLEMRYFAGSDLGVRLAESGPLTVAQALRVGVQMASAVQTAHDAGIIHRDIKPGNILLDSYGLPALSDFGIAGRTAEAGDDDEVGLSMPWSPPEILTGASNGSVVSDVYSLAATIWNLLVGRSPFYVSTDTSERPMFQRILHAARPSTGRPEVPASLDRLLQQAMATDPAHRPQSALELARHLQRIEQELRLARTELPGEGRTDGAARTPADFSPPADRAPAAPARPAPPVAAPVDAAAPTQFKAPVAVRAVQQTTQAPAPAPPTPAPAATPTVAPVRRPRVLEEPARPTEHRPRVAGPAPDPAETVPDETPSGVPRGLVVAAVGVLLVATVGIGALLSKGGEDDTGTDRLPSPSVSTDAEGILPPAAPPVPPATVRGTVRGTSAVFTWEAVPGATSYRWVGADEQSGGDVVRPRVQVPLSAAGQTCIWVRTLAGGQVSTGAKKACA